MIETEFRRFSLPTVSRVSHISFSVRDAGAPRPRRAAGPDGPGPPPGRRRHLGAGTRSTAHWPASRRRIRHHPPDRTRRRPHPRAQVTQARCELSRSLGSDRWGWRILARLDQHHSFYLSHEHPAAVEVQLLLDIHQQILQSSITTVGLVATRNNARADPPRRQHSAVTRSGGRRSRRSVGLLPTAGNGRMATMHPPRIGTVGRVRDRPVPRRGKTL
jgi:hypothetical protein